MIATSWSMGNESNPLRSFIFLFGSVFRKNRNIFGMRSKKIVIFLELSFFYYLCCHIINTY